MTEENRKAIKVEKDMDIKLTFPEGTTKEAMDDYKAKLAEALEKDGHAYIDEKISVEKVNMMKAEEIIVEDKDKTLSFDEVKKLIKESEDNVKAEMEAKLQEAKIQTAEAEAKLASEKEKAEKDRIAAEVAAKEKAALEATTPPKDDPAKPPEDKPLEDKPPEDGDKPKNE